jgi:chorismate lyase/3-hydroxybenzoate synthase
MNRVSSQPLPKLPCLSVERLSLTEWQTTGRSGGASSQSMNTLGALRYGHSALHAEPEPLNEPVTDVAGQMLLDGAPQLDVWRTSGPVEAGHSGQVRWWRSAEWMFGTVDLDESAQSAGLADVSRNAYLDIFRSLDDSSCPHLLRLWNYLPRINIDGGGLERYRQFNSGRQQAFLESKRAAFDGAPAACALGTSAGPLSIRFLAGRHAPSAVENPRQLSAYRYPSTYGPSAPTFSRAALADMGNDHLALLISGTASIVGSDTLHHGDVLAQTHETLRNLQAVIDSAQVRCSARFDIRQLDCVVYVRHPADAPLVRDILSQTLGATSHCVSNAVFLQADICRSDLLVEIEAHAVAVGTVHS